MKTIGLIGGMSWESTVVYYKLLNQMAREKMGGLHSAELIMWSFDFAEIEQLQTQGDWQTAAKKMVTAAQNIEKGGADCVVICTNTMHKMADDIQDSVDIPLIHIADATAIAIKTTSVKHPLLLATRYTMEQAFYTGRLRDVHQISTLVPSDDNRTLIHDVIYDELCHGVISASSKDKYLAVVEQERKENSADGVIFGCTEVGLLISQQDFDIPIFDTTEIHARAAIDFALG